MANFLDGLLSGKNAFTQTTASFAQPAVGANVTVPMVYSGWTAVGATVFIEVGGSYQVVAIPNDSSLTLKNLGAVGNAAVSASVPPGRAAPAGAPGTGGSGGGTFTVDIVARSNIALSGIQSIDGQTTGTKLILVTGNTNLAQNQIYRAGAGAWTAVSIQPVIGDTIFVTDGAEFAKQFFTLVAGVAGTNATIIPGDRPAKINPRNAPWFLKLDYSDETAASDAMFAYCASLTATGGCYIEWPRGTLGRTTPVPGIQFCSHIGAGHLATTFATLNVGQAPCDTFLASSPLNVGMPGLFTISNITFRSAWSSSGNNQYKSSSSTAVGGAAYVAGNYYFHKFPFNAPYMLKCVTPGTTGAHPPIGDLTPVQSAMKLIGVPSIACSPLVKVVTAGALGTAVFQVSVNNGSTWSANIASTVGDYNTIMLAAYAAVGSTYGILISNYANGYSLGIYAPTPRVVVLGTPANDDSMVDITIPTGGPLGAAQFGIASGIRTEKWLFGNTSNSGPGAAGAPQASSSGAFWDYAIPATGLTVRFYAGVYTISSAFAYMTSAVGFGIQPELNSDITDGTAVFRVVTGPSCIRLDGVGTCTLRDFNTEYGCTGVLVCQSENVSIEGTNRINSCWFAGMWLTNGDAKYAEAGQFTNGVTISGSTVTTSLGFGLVHDGGIAFTQEGSAVFQRADLGFCYLAGILGGNWDGSYVECGRGLVRDSRYVSRCPSGKLVGVSFDGFAWASVVDGNYSIDCYGGTQGCKFHGCYGGAIAGIRGIGDSLDVIVSGTHANNGNVCDAQPASGHTHNNQVDTLIAATCIGIGSAGTIGTPVANGNNHNVVLPYAATARLATINGVQPTADMVFTGFVKAGLGQRIRLLNPTVYRATLAHQNGSSTAANRIICPQAANLVLLPGGWADLEYSNADSAWRVIAHSSTAFGANITQASGTTYTATLNDVGRCADLTDAAAIAWTIPPASTAPFPPGTVLTACQLGAGQITATAGAGVTILYPNGKANAKTASQYAHISVRLTDTANTWIALGNLA